MIRGKVVLLPFPFDDLSTTKVRPAVCLTEPVGPHRHVVVAFITSQIPTPVLESDLVLDAKSSGFAATGLDNLLWLRGTCATISKSYRYAFPVEVEAFIPGSSSDGWKKLANARFEPRGDQLPIDTRLDDVLKKISVDSRPE